MNEILESDNSAFITTSAPPINQDNNAGNYVDIFTTAKKYGVIYADPPWLYRDTLGGNAKMGAMPYQTIWGGKSH